MGGCVITLVKSIRNDLNTATNGLEAPGCPPATLLDDEAVSSQTRAKRAHRFGIGGLFFFQPVRA